MSVALSEETGTKENNVCVKPSVKISDEVIGKPSDNDKLLLCCIGESDNCGSYPHPLSHRVEVSVV